MKFVSDLAMSVVTINVSAQSTAIDAAYLLSASVQAVVTGTVAGTLKFQFSNDQGPSGGSFAPTNWSDIPSATVSITNGGTYAIAKTDLCYRWIRLAYVTTSGTGTLNAVVQSFGF